MKKRNLRSPRALTLTELLVVLVIVSLLATIAVPVYLNQIQRARVSTAQAEVREISEAMLAAAATHGYLLPIHILDNVPDPPSGTTLPGDRDDFTSMSSDFATTFLIDIFQPLTNQNTSATQPKLSDRTSNPRVANLINGWQGPFLNPKRVRYVGEVAGTAASGDINQDLVVDPWGRPYRFYTDLGITGTASIPASNPDNITLTITMDNGLLTTNEGSRFDRYAIVSYGPDGVTGFSTDVRDQEDDVYYTFSATSGNETNYQPF